jgi:RimJ/RimL family protein N-acetyltransferase
MMSMSCQPSTSRLVLRQWTEADRLPFAALNADPLVMAHFPAALTRAESDTLMNRCAAQLRHNGHGLWAVQVRASSEFIGFVGLASPGWEAAFTPCTEIGWRLARPAWGQGYATEAANAVLTTAFGQLGLDELVSFATIGNLSSQRVMQRIGMTRDPSEDFDHPRVDHGPVRRHVLYRLSKTKWERGRATTSSDTVPRFTCQFPTPSLGLPVSSRHRP